MAFPVSFRVDPVPGLNAYSVEVRYRSQKYEQFVNIDDPDAREHFLTNIWRSHLQPTYSPIMGMPPLRIALDRAIDAMTLKHGTPKVERMSDVTSTEVQWLWPQVIPAGKLSLLIGVPGVGKTFVALDIAARVTQGYCWPDELHNPVNRPSADVLLLSAEDDHRDTLLPRLEAQGADPFHISLLADVGRFLGSVHKRVSFSLVGTLDKFEQCLKWLPNCRLVVIDPISAYWQGAGASRHADVRELLASLAHLAQKYNVAVLAVNHLNKNLGGPLIYRSVGSLAFAAAARAVWAVVRDPHDRDRRILLPVKNNLARDAHALAFRLKPSDGFRAPAVCWEDGRIDVAALSAPRDRKSRPKTRRLYPRRELAIEWLQRQLVSGQCPSKDLLTAARLENIAEKTLRRALEELGGATHKSPAGHWVWVLPAPQPPDRPTPLPQSPVTDHQSPPPYVANMGKHVDTQRVAPVTTSARDVANLAKLTVNGAADSVPPTSPAAGR